MYAYDLRHNMRILRSGRKYFVGVRVRKLDEGPSDSINIVLKRPSNPLFPIRVLDWWSRDHGSPPDENWNFYHFPEKKLLSGEIRTRRIPFDVSPDVDLGICLLHISVMVEDDFSAGQRSLKWKRLLFVILPRREVRTATERLPEHRSLWDYLPPLPKYGWRLSQTSSETRNAQGFLNGISSTYALREKRVAIFAFSFDNRTNAQAHFQGRVEEWKRTSSNVGEEAVIVRNGFTIRRYIFPKNGIVFGWMVGRLIFVIYAPTAEEEDLRRIFDLMTSN